MEAVVLHQTSNIIVVRFLLFGIQFVEVILLLGSSSLRFLLFGIQFVEVILLLGSSSLRFLLFVEVILSSSSIESSDSSESDASS